MATERFEGEVNDNARVLHLSREALSTGIIPDVNAPLWFVGRIVFSKMERRLHKRQVELQKSGIKPQMKRALIGHSGH